MAERMDTRTAEEVDADAMFDVLLEFELAYPLPTMDDVRTWQARHPAYAWRILRHAAGVAEHVLSGALLEEPRFDPRDERFVAAALGASAWRATPTPET